MNLKIFMRLQNLNFVYFSSFIYFVSKETNELYKHEKGKEREKEGDG